MEKLPNEMIGEILSHLSKNELVIMKNVNKTFYKEVKTIKLKIENQIKGQIIKNCQSINIKDDCETLYDNILEFEIKYYNQQEKEYLLLLIAKYCIKSENPDWQEMITFEMFLRKIFQRKKYIKYETIVIDEFLKLIDKMYELKIGCFNKNCVKYFKIGGKELRLLKFTRRFFVELADIYAGYLSDGYNDDGYWKYYDEVFYDL